MSRFICVHGDVAELRRRQRCRPRCWTNRTRAAPSSPLVAMPRAVRVVEIERPRACRSVERRDEAAVVAEDQHLGVVALVDALPPPSNAAAAECGQPVLTRARDERRARRGRTLRMRSLSQRRGHAPASDISDLACSRVGVTRLGRDTAVEGRSRRPTVGKGVDSERSSFELADCCQGRVGSGSGVRLVVVESARRRTTGSVRPRGWLARGARRCAAARESRRLGARRDRASRARDLSRTARARASSGSSVAPISVSSSSCPAERAEHARGLLRGKRRSARDRARLRRALAPRLASMLSFARSGAAFGDLARPAWSAATRRCSTDHLLASACAARSRASHDSCCSFFWLSRSPSTVCSQSCSRSVALRSTAGRALVLRGELFVETRELGGVIARLVRELGGVRLACCCAPTCGARCARPQLAECSAACACSSLSRRSISAARLRASATLGSSSPRSVGERALVCASSASSSASCASFWRSRRRLHRGLGRLDGGALLQLELRDRREVCCSSISALSSLHRARARSNAALRFVELHGHRAALGALALELVAQLVGRGDRFLQPLLDARACARASRRGSSTRELGLRAAPRRARRRPSLISTRFSTARGELVVFVRELALRIGELALQTRQLAAQRELGIGAFAGELRGVGARHRGGVPARRRRVVRRRRSRGGGGSAGAARSGARREHAIDAKVLAWPLRVRLRRWSAPGPSLSSRPTKYTTLARPSP